MRVLPSFVFPVVQVRLCRKFVNALSQPSEVCVDERRRSHF